MRKIEEQMNEAIANKCDFRSGNTEVEFIRGVGYVTLHGNLICKIFSSGRRLFSNAGWPTVTTKSRLWALGADVRQRKGEWVNADGTPWVNDF